MRYRPRRENHEREVKPQNDNGAGANEEVISPKWPTVAEVERATMHYLREHNFSWSRETVEARKMLLARLIWFLRSNQHEQCGRSEIREFFSYLNAGHIGGRWGNPRQTKKLSRSTVHGYYVVFRGFFKWMVREGLLPLSPMDGFRCPPAPHEPIRTLTADEVSSLLAAAKRSRHPRRDQAIVLLLLDTGMTTSELCRLRVGDLHLRERTCVLSSGRGHKSRKVFFGYRTARALREYLESEFYGWNPMPEQVLVFVGRSQPNSEEPLTHAGVQQLLQRLGKAANLGHANCSPRIFRHTFAVEFMRAGGSLIDLKQRLGHSGFSAILRYGESARIDPSDARMTLLPSDTLRRR